MANDQLFIFVKKYHRELHRSRPVETCAEGPQDEGCLGSFSCSKSSWLVVFSHPVLKNDGVRPLG